MLALSANEARILGVLVEKAQTTPAQYPLTLNALTAGCNQKNNREPLTNLREEQVQESLDSLRGKGLVREVILTGSRVQKFRHVAREALEVDTSQLVILVELLLRGPQTVGELRGRASRMHPLESIDAVSNLLDNLAQRPEPLVRQLPPAPGDRAPRYEQLLSPDLHPVESVASGHGAAGAQSPRAAASEPAAAGAPLPDLAPRVAALESQVKRLQQALDKLAQSLGAADIVREGN